MKYFFGVIILIVLFTNSNYAQSLPRLGQSWINAFNEQQRLYIPSGIHPLSIVKIADVYYSIVTENKKVKYISTNDKEFKINGGKVIGKKLTEFKNKAELKLYLGWGHYLKLDDEWYAAFDFNSISDTSKCLFVFKYDFGEQPKKVKFDSVRVN